MFKLLNLLDTLKICSHIAWWLTNSTASSETYSYRSLMELHETVIVTWTKMAFGQQACFPRFFCLWLHRLNSSETRIPYKWLERNYRNDAIAKSYGFVLCKRCQTLQKRLTWSKSYSLIDHKINCNDATNEQKSVGYNLVPPKSPHFGIKHRESESHIIDSKTKRKNSIHYALNHIDAIGRTFLQQDLESFYIHTISGIT